MPDPSFFRVARRIRAEHRELRARIHGLERNSVRVDLPWARDALRLLFRRFVVRFDAHLRFEERELGPRVRRIDAWGDARVAALLAEHRDQRREIARVATLAEDPTLGDATDFFESVASLGDRLLADIESEEGMLATLAALAESDPLERSLAG
jgi:hypothetical protein